MITVAAMMALAVSMADAARAARSSLTTSVAACGVATRNISVRWDEERQDTIIGIGQPSVRKTVFRCLARTSWNLRVDFEFRSPRLQAEYYAALAATPDAAAAVQLGKTENRQWLVQRGLLEGALRIRAEGGSLDELARKIEVYCGFIPGSVIQVTGSRVWVRPAPDAHVTYVQFLKLLAVMDVVVPEHTPVAVVGEEAR